MNHIIQLEIPDLLFQAMERRATALGSDPATIAMTTLQQHFHSDREHSENAGGADSFEALFGAIDLGYPTGLNNEKIDADLAREYGRGLRE